MTDTPIIYPNLGMSYGNWTGAGYSAGGESPSFVPYLPQQAEFAVLDTFDEASKRHDLDYDFAQQTLLNDLIAGRPRVDALADYYAAMSAADRDFATSASAVTADHAWGEGIRGVGITVMTVKADMQDAIWERLQVDQGYRASIGEIGGEIGVRKSGSESNFNLSSA